MKAKKISMTLVALAIVVSNGTLVNLKAAETPLSVEMPEIIPAPKSITTLGKGFVLTKNINLVGEDVADKDALNELVSFLNDNGFTINENNQETDTTIIMGEADDNLSEIDAIQEKLTLNDASTLKADGYVLAANDNDIMVEGKDGTGTYYGVKTLKEIIQTQDNQKVTPEVAIVDDPDMKDRGVIEGFYGTPWSHEKRLDQLKFYGENKLNLYIYAPKDDPYHREKWREPYPETEMARMQELINTAKANKVNFVFAISPGNDIKFDGAEGEADIQALITKAESMYEMGVRSFAIFFDDISDRSGDKQANVLNQFNDRFIKQKADVTPLITVPTEYFASGMIREGEKSPYTAGFADNLQADIEVMWTGEEVVSQGVSNEDAKLVSDIYGGRKMSLWWNYPVTDYNTKKLALGPVYGLESGIDDNVSILTINPMEFAETSKISIATGADFSWNTEAYDSEKSFKKAIRLLYGTNADDFTYFADHTTRVDTGRPDAPVMQALVNKYYENVMSGVDASVQRDAILAEFKQMKEVSARLLNNLPANILNETSKQLNVFAKNAEYGELAVQMMDCILNNDVQQWWVLKQTSLKQLEDIKTADAQVSNVVKDFITKAHTNGNILYDNTIPKDEKEVIEYTGSASMEAQSYDKWWYNARPYEPANFAIDNDDKAYLSKDNVLANSYVQIDLGKETNVKNIYLLQGRTERDNTVAGTFAYSLDGEDWTTLQNTYSDYETIISNLDIQARYIRYQAINNEDFQWFVRNFKVNKDIQNEKATSNIKDYTGEIARRVENQNESGTKFASVIEANYKNEQAVKAGDTFVLALREFKYIQNVEANFNINGIIEYTRDNVNWLEATAENLAKTPIVSKVRFRAIEDGTIEDSKLTVTTKERNIGVYTTNYSFDDADLEAIHNFDIADVAVDSASVHVGQYLQLDLGETTKINNMKLIFNEAYSSDRPTDVIFEYSDDGENWTKLPFNVYSWYNEYTGLNFDARYIKFTVNGNRGGVWTRIGEFSVNGSTPEAVWETSVNGKQPTNRVTAMNDRDLSTSYIPDSDVHVGDSITYYLNDDRDLKRLHVLQDSNSICDAKVYAQTVNKEEVYLGTLNEAYSTLDMNEHIDVISIRIEFVKDVAVDGDESIEIYEITPEFYTLDEVKQNADKVIKQAEEALANHNGSNSAKETLSDSIDELKNLLTNATERNEIYNSTVKVQNAISVYLESIPSDSTALKIAVEVASKITDEDLKNVVPVVVNEFKAALAEAKEILADKNASQATIDASFTRLANVMHKLNFFKGDKKALQAFIDKVTNLESDKYIETTWNTFADALANGQNVYADENAMQEEVNEAYNSLVRAFLNLRLKPNKDALQDLINKANSLSARNYTDVSWAAMQNELIKANAVFNNPSATQDEITAAYEDLNAAINGLTAINIINAGDSVTVKGVKTGDSIKTAGLFTMLFGSLLIGLSKKRKETEK